MSNRNRPLRPAGAVCLAIVLVAQSFAADLRLARLALMSPAPPQAPGQPAPPRKLNIVIIDGEGALNNIRLRVAREPIVQVEDENRKPVAGAAVTFLTPNQGASAVFPNGGRSITVISDNQGRAIARGVRPNNVAGKFEIRVSASHEGQTASAVITQTNAMIAAAAAAGISAKMLTWIIVAGAAAAAGGTAIAVTRGDDGPATPSATVLTPGTPTVTPPR